MYKSKLQELCMRCSWELPEYKSIKSGLDHMPRFTASVTVHGQVFETPAQCNSSKEAQNTAARVAFEHFTTPPPAQAHCSPETPSASAAISFQTKETPPATPAAPLPELQLVAAATELLPLSPVPASLPFPPSGFLVPKNANSTIASADILQKNYNLHIYKIQLQEFAQKKKLGLPMYTTKAEGPPHTLRFKSSVLVGGKSYVTMKCFTTRKQAEMNAARVAYSALTESHTAIEYSRMASNSVCEDAESSSQNVINDSYSLSRLDGVAKY